MHRTQPKLVTPLCEALAAELLHNDAARFVQRLHAVLLVTAGRSCAEVAHWLDHSPRTIERWARAYESGGVEQLRVTHAGGRPGRLPSTQQQLLWADVGRVPTELGYHYRQWSGKLLALHLARHYGLTLSTRQCQRWLSTLPKSELGPSTTDKGTDTTADPSLGTDR